MIFASVTSPRSEKCALSADSSTSGGSPFTQMRELPSVMPLTSSPQCYGALPVCQRETPPGIHALDKFCGIGKSNAQRLENGICDRAARQGGRMGKAKKTRKFAEVKRMLHPKDIKL